MSAIRICAITSDNYPQDPLVRRTAEAAAAEYEYHVICAALSDQTPNDCVNGVLVHRISVPGSGGKRITGMPFAKTVLLWIVFTILALKKSASLHFKYRFDVLHVHNLPDFLVFAALIPKLLGARVILHVQDVAPELMAVKTKGIFRRLSIPLAKFQERVSTSFADHVLTVGWPFEPPLLKRGVPPAKLSSLLNSADPNIFPEEKRTEPFLGEPTAERPLVLMYHGTIAERNGLDTAVRALAVARRSAPHLRLYINGSGPAVSALKRMAKTLNIAEQVAFFPNRPLDALADFVASGDIGIIPYPSDGFMELVLPTKAYEFAWMRRPMIASSTAGVCSLFGPGSVRLCEPGNVDSFADAIIDLYQHPQKRAELVGRAEEDYRPYRWELMAERYRQLLASLSRRDTRQAEFAGSVEISE